MSKKHRIILFILLALMSVAICHAVPAKRSWHKVLLDNGDSISVSMIGDELCHYLSTESGIPVIEISEGVYRLAPEIQDSISARWKERLNRRNAHRASAAAKTRKQAFQQTRAFGIPTQYTGKKKGIVILVNTPDTKMISDNPNEVFSNHFNQEGYSEYNNTGSVHDYFLAQSYGKFDLTFDVFGPVTVSHEMAFYGKNDSHGDDLYPAVLAVEACKLANLTCKINWHDYDWNGDGYVDQVYFIYAGGGEHATSIKEQIWPHESTLNEERDCGDGNGEITLGGVKIDTYAMSCELRGTSLDKIDGIGTACHEFSHCLGIPDMYNTDNGGSSNMGYWDLMDCGSYCGLNGCGESPTGYSAYERWFCGWLEFTELRDNCTISNMPALQDSPTAYIIYNDGDKDEYFILENRQSSGWFKYVDTYIGIHGMLITHVDYDQTAWSTDRVNADKSHQRMSPIPADGRYANLYTSNAELKGDLFPGSKNITLLSNTSHTNAGGKLFSPNTDGSYFMNKTISNINERSGKISFTFTNNNVAESISPTLCDSDTEYYTLSGIRISEPTQRGVYVVKKGDKVQRMLISR